MPCLNLAAIPPKITQVPLDELGGYANVRSLTAAELVEINKKFGDKAEVGESHMAFLLQMVLKCCVDDQGKNVFVDEDSMLYLPIQVLIKLAEAAVDASGLDLKKKN